MISKMRKMLKNRQFRCEGECNITYEETIKRMNLGAILVDVRSIQEYKEGHLYNAVHLADYEIPKKYNRILPNKEQDIILYCQNGTRSKKALKRLKKLGYLNVYNLCGGLENIN